MDQKTQLATQQKRLCCLHLSGSLNKGFSAFWVGLGPAKVRVYFYHLLGLHALSSGVHKPLVPGASLL